jgi:microcompartment protein CcmL/EutN
VDTLGVVESKGIASGVALADGMLKAADVVLVRAATICSGRYLIHVSGDCAAVETAVRWARSAARALAGSFVIANVSPQVLEALKHAGTAAPGEALGVVECRTVSSGLAAADHAVKRAAIRLLRFVAGQGINGKSYFVISGDVAAVAEASEAAATALGRDLVETVVIPRPSAPIVQALTSGAR